VMIYDLLHGRWLLVGVFDKEKPSYSHMNLSIKSELSIIGARTTLWHEPMKISCIHRVVHVGGGCLWQSQRLVWRQ
jgi:hypothetical protein